jgi:ribosomal protein S18 acetylase RimI-like enzyme
MVAGPAIRKLVSRKAMVTLEPITEQNIFLFKATRLRALQDTPSAFGATFAKESLLTDADWIKRAAKWNGQKGILYLAMDGCDACGMAGSFLDDADATRAYLISMWTAPTHRQQGVGRLLVDEIFRWGRLRGVRTMLLMVTSSNHHAIAFYKRLGFTLTGRTEPYPNDPALIEFEMYQAIA